jgi:hypothetical protein
MNANHISIAALIISCLAVVLAVLPKTQTVQNPEDVTREDLEILEEATHKSFAAHSSDLHHLDVDLLKLKGKVDTIEKDVKYLKHAKANAKQPKK